MIVKALVKATAYSLTDVGLIIEHSAAYYVVTYEWPSFGWEQMPQLPFPSRGATLAELRFIY